MCLTHLAKSIDSSRLLYIDSMNLSSDIIALTKSRPALLNIRHAFEIEDSPLRPDAVILETLSNFQQIEIKNTYYLGIKDWNDYHYKTAFNCTNPYFKKKKLKIAYANQKTNKHTYDELRKLCITPTNQHHYLIINSRLSNIFYSFWLIDMETVNYEVLSLMYMFNHIFYIAIENGIYTKDKFDDFCHNLEGDVFRISLFRDAYRFSRNLTKLFAEFVQAITSLNISLFCHSPVFTNIRKLY